MNTSRKWSKRAGVMLAFSVVLLTAAVVYASGDAHDSLSPEKLKDLFWRAANFAGLVVILVWALRKPIANGLSARRQGIREQFDDLESQKAAAEQVYKEYESKLSRIDEEVSKIINAAVAQGETEKQRIIDEANRAAGDIKRQAEMAVQHELAEAKRQLKTEVADQAVLMAEEILRKNFQEVDQAKLVDMYLDRVGAIQ